MKAQVLKAYIDKETKVLHTVGEEVELTEARAKELSEGGYVSVEKTKTPRRTKK